MDSRFRPTGNDLRRVTPHDDLLQAVAHAELAFERYRLIRRWCVAGAAIVALLATLLLWRHASEPSVHRSLGMVLYGLFAPLAIVPWLYERLARRGYWAQLERLRIALLRGFGNRP